MRGSGIWALVVVLGACGGRPNADGAPDPGAADTADQPEAVDTPATVPAPRLVGTTWRLTELGGKPAPLGQDGKAATLELMADGGRASGFAGCNRMAGTFSLKGDSLRIGPLALTRMACTKGMDLEQAYTRAVEQTRAYRISDQSLELLGAGGTLARLEAQ